MQQITEATIGRVCHEAIRALQAATGSTVTIDWDNTTPAERESTIRTIRTAREGMTPEAIHRDWCQRMTAQGWTYGPQKDSTRRTHPCLVPFRDLPEHEQAKDRLFFHIVHALTPED